MLALCAFEYLLFFVPSFFAGKDKSRYFQAIAELGGGGGNGDEREINPSNRKEGGGERGGEEGESRMMLMKEKGRRNIRISRMYISGKGIIISGLGPARVWSQLGQCSKKRDKKF